MAKLAHKLAGVTLLCGMALSTGPANAETGVALLKVENGARSSGMGEAFVSVAGDPLSQYFNPAASVGTRDFTAYLGHTAYWENIDFQTGLFSFSKSRVRFNVSARIAEVDDIEARSNFASDAPLYLFAARDISLKAGAAYPVNERLSVGFGAGWILEKIDFFNASAFNVDFGAHYRRSDKLAFGASVTNLGGDLTLNNESVSLPTTVRAGASYTLAEYSALVAVDGVIVDDQFHAHFGAEYSGIKQIDIRAGYQSGYDSKNVTFGAGFHKKGIRVDYAFVPYSNSFGDSHQFGLSVFFN